MYSGSTYPQIPSPLRQILLLIGCTTLFIPIAEVIFNKFFGVIGPQSICTLSFWGVKNLYAWQLVTHGFFHGLPGEGISFPLLFELVFHMFLIAKISEQILYKLSSIAYLRFYLGSTMVAGITASLGMIATGQHTAISGTTPAILALAFLWCMFYRNANMFLLIMPFSARGLAGLMILLISLINLSEWNLIHWFWDLGGILSAYFYGICAHNLQSPFHETEKMDRFIGNLWHKLHIPFIKQKTPKKPTTIYDFKTGRIIKKE